MHKIDDLPRDVGRAILQDACRALRVNDVSLIAPAIAKLTKVLSLMPRLDRFVRDVCAIVFDGEGESQGEGEATPRVDVGGRGTKSNREKCGKVLGKAGPGDDPLLHHTMESALPIIQAWKTAAAEGVKMAQLRQDLGNATPFVKKSNLPSPTSCGDSHIVNFYALLYVNSKFESST